MAKKITSIVKKSETSTEQPSPRSIHLIADGDVKDAQHFAKVLSALMSDALMNAIPPSQGNVVCKAAGLIIKVTEMQLKYGPKDGGSLMLTGPN
jgi:hypothetical protein